MQHAVREEKITNANKSLTTFLMVSPFRVRTGRSYGLQVKGFPCSSRGSDAGGSAVVESPSSAMSRILCAPTVIASVITSSISSPVAPFFLATARQ